LDFSDGDSEEDEEESDSEEDLDFSQLIYSDSFSKFLLLSFSLSLFEILLSLSSITVNSIFICFLINLLFAGVDMSNGVDELRLRIALLFLASLIYESSLPLSRTAVGLAEWFFFRPTMLLRYELKVLEF